MTCAIDAAINAAVDAYRAKLQAEVELSRAYQRGVPGKAVSEDCHAKRVAHRNAEDSLRAAIEREGLVT